MEVKQESTIRTFNRGPKCHNKDSEHEAVGNGEPLRIPELSSSLLYQQCTAMGCPPPLQPGFATGVILRC